MRKVLAVALLLVSGWVRALPPDVGWWWNPAQGGRGYSIEVQNNFMFFAGYLYNADGSATWYVAQGPYDNNNNTFTGQLLAFGGGPCITCAFTQATQRPSPGTITLVFSTPKTGTLTWPGGSFPITRFIYGVGERARRFAGRWAFSTAGVSGTVPFSNFVAFTGTLQDPSLGLVLTGTTEGGRVVVAATNSTDTETIVLIDASASFWELYRFPTDFIGPKNASALWVTYSKSSTAPPGGGLAVASQINMAPNATSPVPPAKAGGLDYGAILGELASVRDRKMSADELEVVKSSAAQ